MALFLTRAHLPSSRQTGRTRTKTLAPLKLSVQSLLLGSRRVQECTIQLGPTRRHVVQHVHVTHGTIGVHLLDPPNFTSALFESKNTWTHQPHLRVRLRILILSPSPPFPRIQQHAQTNIFEQLVRGHVHKQRTTQMPKISTLQSLGDDPFFGLSRLYIWRIRKAPALQVDEGPRGTGKVLCRQVSSGRPNASSLFTTVPRGRRLRKDPPYFIPTRHQPGRHQGEVRHRRQRHHHHSRIHSHRSLNLLLNWFNILMTISYCDVNFMLCFDAIDIWYLIFKWLTISHVYWT